jgi:hypothetical protein
VPPGAGAPNGGHSTDCCFINGKSSYFYVILLLQENSVASQFCHVHVENKGGMIEAKNIPLSKCTDSTEQILHVNLTVGQLFKNFTVVDGKRSLIHGFTSSPH